VNHGEIFSGLAWPEIAQMSANVAGMDLDRLGFSRQNKHMCSALYTARGRWAHRAWADGQEYWAVCAREGTHWISWISV